MKKNVIEEDFQEDSGVGINTNDYTTCCCIIDNKSRIFNYIDCLDESTSMLNYYINEKDESHIKMFESLILRELNLCICDKEYVSMYYRNYTYWTIKYDDKYIHFDGNTVYFCDYPAFFVRIPCDKEYEGGFEKVNVYACIVTVICTVGPLFDKLDIDMDYITCEPCFEHAHLYSDNKEAFELLYNTEYKEEYMFGINEKDFLDHFEFKMYEY